jgi:hypothetical protein
MGSEGTSGGRLIAPIAVLGVALFALGAAGSASARAPLTLGFDDALLFESGDPAVRKNGFDMATDLRAGIVRVAVGWRGAAPSNPSPLFDPRDPSDPEYRFSAVDAAVREASSRGLEVIIHATTAPSWAEGPDRPPDARPGTWRPDPSAYGAFAVALASRYSGTFPDPIQPTKALPKVRYYQAWNEPNLPSYLAPQWSNGRAESPIVYRRLLNAFYDAVKSVDPQNTVLTAGVAPYGESGFGPRMHPVQFLRHLFCLQGRRRLRVVCGDRTRFDILADHPIDAYRPTRPADHPDDAATPDIGRIRRVLRRAIRAGTAQPRGAKPIWATELWWYTNPPTPGGVPPSRQARWIEQALYVLWQQGVHHILLQRLSDGTPTAEQGTGYGTGLVFSDGRRKPAYQAVRFPFVADRLDKRRVRVWGRPPDPGRVRIQRRARGAWRTVARVRARGRSPFSRKLALRGRARLRAVAGTQKSLIWSQR